MDSWILAVDCHHGVYIPKVFVECYAHHLDMDDKEIAFCVSIIREGPDDPDNDFYWEAWDELMSRVSITIEGVKYSLHQDDDLWLVPEDYDWDESF